MASSILWILLAEKPFFLGFTWEVGACLLILCVLLLCSALASASETAYFSLQPNDINELSVSHRRAEQLVLQIKQKPKTLLATILITNNLINVTITIFSTYIMTLMFDLTVNPVAAFVLNVVVVTSLILLFGEMVPKIYATKCPKKMAVRMARVLRALMVIFKPLSKILVQSTSFVDKRIAKKNTISLSDLSTAVDITTDEETPLDEKNMLKGIATFGEKEVSDVMQPRVDVFAISDETCFEEILILIVENGFSRIPIYKETLDEILGILYVKDLLPYLEEKDFDWQKLIRSAFFVPENKKINDLFQDFRAKKIHIAIVVDEYGGTSGLVTMEDILEEIVGDISDEFDKVIDNKYYTKIDDNTFLFKAQTSLIDFCKVFGINEDYFEQIKGESDTLAGMMLEYEGRIPEVGFQCRYEEFVFEIEKSDLRRIIEIKVIYNKNKAKDEYNQ